MRLVIWLAMTSVFAIYFALVVMFGFAGPVALALHFLRFAIVAAVLIIYIPGLRYIFTQVPSPGRDYLLAGLIGFLVSNEYFSILNEAGRVFKVDTSILTSWVSGIGSLIVVISGGYLLLAPGKDKTISPYVAVTVGLVLGALLVFIAPLFR